MTHAAPRGLLSRLRVGLLRVGLLRESPYGQPPLGYRLLRIRFVPALFLSAPALALILWYTYLAVASHTRHRLALKEDEPLTLDLLQLHLHDQLARDRRRLTMPEPLEKSAIPTIGLMIGGDAWTKLDRMLPPGEGDAYYVGAHLTYGSEVYNADIRYRGTRHWHWNHPQKSWKVRLQNRTFLDGRAVFGFVNTPEPMPFDEYLILDVARKSQLLAPDYYPFRLLINRAYLGVYFFLSQPDEGLLRASNRMSGSIYSGDGAPADPETGVSALWQNSKYWKKVAALDATEAKKKDELEALLDAVGRAGPVDFAAFAERYLDLEKLARADALDVVFGINQHDYDQNHKLYFDPYRGRFEPVAWSYRGTKHQPVFNRTENPLLLRLKQLPGWTTRRNRKAYEFLRSSCSTADLRARTLKLFDELAPDQLRDPYWDAYHLLPNLGDYYRELLRPMDRSLQAVVARQWLSEHEDRVQYLLGELSSQHLQAALRTVSATAPGAFALDVVVSGHAGYEIEGVEPRWPEACADRSWELFADQDLDDLSSRSLDRRIAGPLATGEAAAIREAVHPGLVLVSRRPHPRRGRVRSDSSPRRYRFFGLPSACRPETVAVTAKNLVTGARVTASARWTEHPESPSSATCPKRPPRDVPGEQTPHPWCFPRATPETVHLGPGPIEVAETRVFERWQSVVIEPGTTFKLGKKASLIFYGHVDARGTALAPIRFEPQGKRWGGVALQGSGTAGSHLSHVHLERGSHAQFGLTHFPGMINLHDTSDVEIDHAEFLHQTGSDDCLHAAYVEGLSIHDTRFFDVAMDALDLEFSSALLDRLTVAKAGDECLDLMESRVEVRRSQLVACRGRSISAGEETTTLVVDSLLARAQQGIMVKNGSQVTLLGTLISEVKVGVRREAPSQWYVGKSNVSSPELFVVQSPQPLQSAEGKLKNIPHLHTTVAEGDLTPLRRDVLGLDDWSRLGEKLDRLQRGRP